MNQYGYLLTVSNIRAMALWGMQAWPLWVFADVRETMLEQLVRCPNESSSHLHSGSRRPGHAQVNWARPVRVGHTWAAETQQSS